ncbi:MAG: hypothetical protein ACYCV5_04965 [Acidimicrobiales bacterium]
MGASVGSVDHLAGRVHHNADVGDVGGRGTEEDEIARFKDAPGGTWGPASN